MKKYPHYFMMTLAWFAIFYFMFSGFAYRADFKIGYVQSRRILSEYKEFVEVNKTIEEESNKLQSQLKSQQDEYQKKVKLYESQSLMLSDAKKAEFTKELQGMQANIYGFQQENFAPGGTLEKRWQELTTPILNKVQTAIDKIGSEEGYDLILDSQQGVLLYAKDEYDLTDRIMEELGNQ